VDDRSGASDISFPHVNFIEFSLKGTTRESGIFFLHPDYFTVFKK